MTHSGGPPTGGWGLRYTTRCTCGWKTARWAAPAATSALRAHLAATRITPGGTTVPADQPRRPHFGFTRHRLPVHLRTTDHLPEGSAYQRFNKKAAVWLTTNVGSMTAFWLFTLASAFVAPSCLYAAGYIHWHVFITSFGFELLATLILSTWLELALMPAIMVGQGLQSAASDARSAKQFEDTEEIREDIGTALDRLDVTTTGGLADVMALLQRVYDLAAAAALHQQGKDT